MVRKDTAPSYVIELEMKTTAYDRKILDKKMRIGKNIYNACLGEAQKRLRAVRADKTYRMTVKSKQAISATYHTAKVKQANQRTAKEKDIISQWKQIIEEIYAIEQSYGYSEYQLHAFVAPSKRSSPRILAHLKHKSLQPGLSMRLKSSTITKRIK